ncbi:hypothetical protein QJS66_04750 [Kocuria rhizophila]|nr:hypothetical protein QJS66_04750 [Kocuria rhizophila]
MVRSCARRWPCRRAHRRALPQGPRRLTPARAGAPGGQCGHAGRPPRRRSRADARRADRGCGLGGSWLALDVSERLAAHGVSSTVLDPRWVLPVTAATVVRLLAAGS